MITPSFALTATERVLPRMALDFTTASLDSRVTFTRSGNTATVVNSSGYVAGINADLPRFDYDPVALTCKGLLIEESRTNLVLQSQDFATTWSGTAAITTNTTVSPSNIQDADTLNATVADQLTQQVVTVVNNALPNVFSVFLKQGTAAKTTIYLTYFGGASVSYSATFNWATKTISDDFSSATAVGVQQYANGFYRIYLAGANNNALNTSLTCRIYPAQVGFLGGSTGTVFAWGAQTEAGAFPTSYIPTVASQVTRTADTATMTGTNFSSWYNASEGAFVASSVIARQSALGATAVFSANDNTAANLINCFYRASGALGSNIFAATVSQFDQTPLGVTAANTIVNIGVAYKLNDSVSYASGTIQTIDTTVTVPTVNQLQFGFTPTGAYLNGYVRSLRYYKQRILNAEGQAFSK